MVSCAPSTRTAVPLQDRIHNTEATLVAFAAENSLSAAFVPRLVTLCQTVAVDRKALEEVHLGRTAATYKLIHGVAKTCDDDLMSELQTGETKFSLNIDEATSKSNNARVLAVLVSYFSPSMKQVKVQHLASVSVVSVDSKTLYDVLVNLFHEKGLKWSNCMSILMDSCAVMRGNKSGLET